MQIRKYKNAYYHMWKIILTQNLLKFNIEPLLKYFQIMSFVYESPYDVCNGRVSGAQIESGSTCMLPLWSAAGTWSTPSPLVPAIIWIRDVDQVMRYAHAVYNQPCSIPLHWLIDGRRGIW